MRKPPLAFALLVAAAHPPPSQSPTRSARRSSPTTRRASGPTYPKTGEILTVCKPDSRPAGQPALEGQGQEDQPHAAPADQAAQALQVPAHPGRGRRRDERRPHPHLPGRLPRGAEPRGHVQRPEVLARGPEVLGADGRLARRGRQGPDLPVPLGLQELAQPHPDHGRLARRPGPRVRPEVQPAARGPRPQPEDVLIVGDRLKRDVLRADRADGIVIKNLTAEQGSFNGVDVVETNGFLIQDVVGRYNQNYGILTFTSDNGLYDRTEGYGNGDSGLYPGSGPEGHCQRYGIEIRNSSSHDNVLGQSGTAGNGTWVHDSKWFNNGVGIVNDSFASGHPGMPQDCSKWEDNDVYSNNENFFDEGNQDYCKKTPFKDRPRDHVCPQFQSPVGTGLRLLRREREHHPQQQGLGQLALGLPAVLGAGRDPRRQQLPRRSATRRTATRSPTTSSASRPPASRAQRRRRRSGTSRATATAGRATRAPGRQGDERPGSLPTCASGGSAGASSRPTRSARDPAVRDVAPERQPGPARLRLVHHAAEAGSGRDDRRSRASGSPPPPRSPRRRRSPPCCSSRAAPTAARQARLGERAAGVQVGQADRPRADRADRERVAAADRPRRRGRADPRRRRRRGESTVRFLEAFAHGLWSWSQAPRAGDSSAAASARS